MRNRIIHSMGLGLCVAVFFIAAGKLWFDTACPAGDAVCGYVDKATQCDGEELLCSREEQQCFPNEVCPTVETGNHWYEDATFCHEDHIKKTKCRDVQPLPCGWEYDCYCSDDPNNSQCVPIMTGWREIMWYIEGEWAQ